MKYLSNMYLMPVKKTFKFLTCNCQGIHGLFTRLLSFSVYVDNIRENNHTKCTLNAFLFILLLKVIDLKCITE